ncbi:PrsW family intramembrane metalloprotease [Serinibacter arcticus]|uniref:PrsW family intramembrane metalloprotease n=1 Tax=Serinibacter arcticus TaxID=1655435 RepID=A0A2U1ZS08_9MICO|nr:PrsW family intramembrane metalloprotease [Serinibacter arcticus]PWD49775.1 PrsW family intramembrane metalloprotease [Serinibacter arcticus]
MSSGYPGPSSSPSNPYPAPSRPPADRSGYGHGPAGASPYGHSPAPYDRQAPVQPPIWHGGQRSAGLGTGTIVALCVVGFAGLWGLWIALSQVGPAPAAIGFLAALIPLAVVLAAVMWLDRWEPEPKVMLLIALLWGAGVSVVLSFYGNTAVSMAVYEATGDPNQANIIGAVVSAPVLEETTKGLGVLLIFLLRRKYFDGVVDGIVYAAVVAAGFAFTENIIYFGRAVEILPSIFFTRGVMSPFAHILFTACIGIALGIASRHRNAAAVWWLFPVGLLGAMALHALWNASASLGQVTGNENTFFLVYGLVQIPLFVAAIVLAFWLRRQESAAIRARLTEYAGAGWFAPHEIEMVASLRTRAQARAWAARMGPNAAAAMKRFQKDATSLAYLRQRAISGRADLRTHGSGEAELLASLSADRQAFQAAAPQAFGR